MRRGSLEPVEIAKFEIENLEASQFPIKMKADKAASIEHTEQYREGTGCSTFEAKGALLEPIRWHGALPNCNRQTARRFKKPSSIRPTVHQLCVQNPLFTQ